MFGIRAQVDSKPPSIVLPKSGGFSVRPVSSTKLRVEIQPVPTEQGQAVYFTVLFGNQTDGALLRCSFGDRFYINNLVSLEMKQADQVSDKSPVLIDFESGSKVELGVIFVNLIQGTIIQTY